MENLLADSMVRRKVVLSLMAAFAVVALLLAAIGTYGVMSVAANQRVREIGIRMALGAQRRDIERLMVRPGLALAAAGVAAGIVTAVFLARLMSAMLFAVAPTDAATYASVSLLLILVALAACYVPARRATKQDPLIALRTESDASTGPSELRGDGLRDRRLDRELPGRIGNAVDAHHEGRVPLLHVQRHEHAQGLGHRVIADAVHRVLRNPHHRTALPRVPIAGWRVPSAKRPGASVCPRSMRT